MSTLVTRAFVVAVLIGIFGQGPCWSVQVAAYSLSQAQRRAKAGEYGDPGLSKLAGITRPLAFVVDPATGDIILVGAVVQGLPEARLDDLVVSLRARLVYGEWPLVSIEPDTNTVHTGLQRVIFQGGIRHTQFGRDFFEADVALKRYSLNVLPVHPEVATYRDLCAADAELDAERSGTKVEGIEWLSEEVGTLAVAAVQQEEMRDFASYFARFWFSPENEADLAARQGVFCIKRLNMIVSAESQQVAGTNSKAFLAEAFARNFALHFDEMADFLKKPEIARLKTLSDLLCIAYGVERLPKESRLDLDYFLTQYPLPPVITRTAFEQIDLRARVRRSDKQDQVLTLSGGIQLRAKLNSNIEALKDGILSQLRIIVLGSRPGANALWWRLPLGDWKFQNTQHVPASVLATAFSPRDGAAEESPGMCVRSSSVILNSRFLETTIPFLGRNEGPAGGGNFSAAAYDRARYETAKAAVGRTEIKGTVWEDKAKSTVRIYEQVYKEQKGNHGSEQNRPAMDTSKMEHNLPNSGTSSYDDRNLYLIAKQALGRGGLSGTVWEDRAKKRVDDYEKKNPSTPKVNPSADGAPKGTERNEPQHGAKFEGFSGGQAPMPVRGVSMQMVISEEHFDKSWGAELEDFRRRNLSNRPSPDSLSWPAPKFDGKR